MTVTTVEVFDDDGVLALVDLATYHPFVSEHWDLDGLLGHFDAEMQARHAIVWRCGDQGGDEWQVEFRPIRSTAVAHR